MKRVRLSEKDLFLLNMFNSSASPCSWKQEKSHIMYQWQTWKQTQAAHSINHCFTFYCFDVDCHNPPPKHQSLKVQIYAFYSLQAPPADRCALSPKSQRHSVACVNVSVTTHFIRGVSGASIVNQCSQQRERQIPHRRVEGERVWENVALAETWIKKA